MGWLYVPGLADSNLALASLSPDTKLCVTSSGKPSVRLPLWRGWRTRPWIARLCGTISQPLMATRGVEQWIWSLEDSRVSRGPLPASDRVPPTTDGSGMTSSELLERSSRRSCSLKTCQDWSAKDCESCGKIYDAWVTTFKRDSLVRQKLARRIADSDSLSWPTATATDASGRGYTYSRGDHSKIAMALPGKAKAWATPHANCHTGPGRQGREGGPNLQTQVLSEGMQLNPRFVEWLMGMPIGWTAFAPLGMEWSHWLSHMRSELLRLDSR